MSNSHFRGCGAVISEAPYIILQVDCVDSSEWREHATPPSITDFTARLQRHVNAIVSHHGGQQFKQWQSDGGAFIFSEADQDDPLLSMTDSSVLAALHVRSSVPILTKIMHLCGFDDSAVLSLRISLHKTNIQVKGSDFPTASAAELSWFLKNERTIGDPNHIVITEEVYGALRPPLRAVFVKKTANPVSIAERSTILYVDCLSGLIGHGASDSAQKPNAHTEWVRRATELGGHIAKLKELLDSFAHTDFLPITSVATSLTEESEAGGEARKFTEDILYVWYPMMDEIEAREHQPVEVRQRLQEPKWYEKMNYRKEVRERLHYVERALDRIIAMHTNPIQ